MIIPSERDRLLHPVLLANYRAANLGQNSYIKPFKKPDLKYFAPYGNDNEVVKIDWEIYAIKGTVQLTGNYNLMYWNKQYFFLDIIRSLGDINHEYSVTRWFWVNDVLENDYLKIVGTLSRTSDSHHFENNYELTTPTVATGNDALFYPVVTDDSELTDEKLDIRYPWDFLLNEKRYKRVVYFDNEDIAYRSSIQKFMGVDTSIPSFTKVWPFLIYQTWEAQLVNELINWLDDEKTNIQVFDLNTTGSKSHLAQVLGPKFPNNKNKHFVIADKNFTGVKEFANTLVQTWDIDNIDLSTLTKITPVKEQALTEDPQALATTQLKNHKTGLINVKLNDFSFKRVTDRRVIKKDGVVQDQIKEFGFLKGIEISNQISVITGYTGTEKITVDLDYSDDQERLYIDLNHYEISVDEEVLNSPLLRDEIKRFLFGESEKLDEAFLNKWTGIQSGNDLWILQIKKIPLEEGWTINDKSYLEYLVGEHAYKLAQGMNQALPDSGEFVDEDDFAQLKVSHYHYPLSDYKPSNLEEWKSKHHIKLPEGNKWPSYRKGQFFAIIRTLQNAFVYHNLAKIIKGFIAYFPEDINNKLNINMTENISFIPTPPDMEKLPWGKSFVYSIFTEQLHTINTTGSTSIRNFDGNEFCYPTGGDSGYDDIRIVKTNRPGFNNMTKDDALKAINLWFKNWNDLDSSKAGDFYIIDELVPVRMLSKIPGRSIPFTVASWCITIFKMYKGAAYYFMFPIRANENNLFISSSSKFSIQFRKWYGRRLFGETGSYSSATYTMYNARLSKILWYLHILSEQNVEFIKKGRSLFHHDGYCDWGDVIYQSPSEVPIWDRVQGGTLVFKDYKKYLRQDVVRIDDANQALSFLYQNHPFFNNEWTENHDVLYIKKDKQLFDLEGTNFYLYRSVTEGKVNFELIVKNNDTSLKNVVAKTSYKMAQATRNLVDPIEIVNSALSLNLWGTQIPIKWRGPIVGKFSPEEFFITPLTRDGSNHADDVYLLVMRTDQDYIREVIKVMKPESALVSNMNLSERENLRFRYKQELLLSRNQMESFNLSRDKFFANLQRQREDIDFFEQSQYYNMVGSVLGGVGAALTAPFTGGFGMLGVASSVSNIMSTFENAERDSYQRRRDYEFEKTFGSREFALRSDAERANFKLRDMQKKFEIYNLSTNARLQSPSGDSTLFSSIKEKLKTADIYLQVVYPSGTQYENLKNYYEEFGFTVNIPNFHLTTSGIDETSVIQFSNIDEIQGIENPIIASNVKALFLEGFRVKDYG